MAQDEDEQELDSQHAQEMFYEGFLNEQEKESVGMMETLGLEVFGNESEDQEEDVEGKEAARWDQDTSSEDVRTPGRELMDAEETMSGVGHQAENDENKEKSDEEDADVEIGE